MHGFGQGMDKGSGMSLVMVLRKVCLRLRQGFGHEFREGSEMALGTYLA